MTFAQSHGSIYICVVKFNFQSQTKTLSKFLLCVQSITYEIPPLLWNVTLHNINSTKNKVEGEVV